MSDEISTKPPKETIAVVGGGMTGIAAALGLAQSGRFAVTLLEKQDRIGGLSGYFQWQEAGEKKV